jgi:hypothetical protein
MGMNTGSSQSYLTSKRDEYSLGTTVIQGELETSEVTGTDYGHFGKGGLLLPYDLQKKAGAHIFLSSGYWGKTAVA